MGMVLYSIYIGTQYFLLPKIMISARKWSVNRSQNCNFLGLKREYSLGKLFYKEILVLFDKRKRIIVEKRIFVTKLIPALFPTLPGKITGGWVCDPTYNGYRVRV